jgi:DNA-binding transcriptional regulator YiaG
MTPDEFRGWRILEGLSRDNAAGFLGISPRTIEGWEQGRAKIPLWACLFARSLSYIWRDDFS